MENDFRRLTADIACAALRAAGLPCRPEDVGIESRDDRWAVLLPDERIAWFPASEPAAERLAVERRVLRLLAERCSFRAPRLLLVSDRGFDVRQMVPGRCDPSELFRRCQADAALAQRIGRSIGAILAEQHTRIEFSDVSSWLPRQVAWPETGTWIRVRLPGVVDDRDLVRTIGHVIERYEAAVVDADDHVLLHGDVGLHNLALDPDTDAVNGIFDYDSAAWADRHHDLRNLLFDIGRDDMLEAALAIYEPAVGRRIDRRRILLYNAACAISYLAFRAGIPPDRVWCGRTLADDLRWVRATLSRLAQ